MPEGPELHLASRFINHVCKDRVFGKIFKSEISKNPVVYPPADRYRITASSRGKEIKIALTEIVSDVKDSKDKLSIQPKSLDILFTFGLAGKFNFYEACELQKHAHLNFFTCDSGPDMVLSFVDYMRFGKWSPGVDFSLKERGPCVLFDYSNFRDKVLQNLDTSAFNKPICEVLLNQKYFNGIGNYLRAEILHRAKVPPFVSARSVLEPLAQYEVTVKSETPDILQLCHILPQEVLELESSWYDGKERSDDSNPFNAWLQCYYQDGMKNIADHNKRTIWYSGPLGPLAPKDGKVRARKTKKSKRKSSESEEVIGQPSKKMATKRRKKEDDISEEEAVPSETKKAKLSKAAKTKLVKKENKTKAEELDDKQENVRTNGKKSVRQREDIWSCNGDLSEALKSDLQKGRLTRGKIKQIVETIEHISEKKTNGKRKKTVKEEKVAVKSESKEDEKVSLDCDSGKNACSILSQNETEGHVGIKTEVPETLVLSARTKSRARVGRVLNNNAAYLHSSNNTQKRKLRTPRKKSLRSLSST